MASDSVERKLAAILVADMVGFSRLMERDEEGTIARQKRHRTELIDPTIAILKGRIVKTTGDGMLVEFASVVDAVTCAVEIQEATKRARSIRPRLHASSTALASTSAISSLRATRFLATA